MLEYLIRKINNIKTRIDKEKEYKCAGFGKYCPLLDRKCIMENCAWYLYRGDYSVGCVMKLLLDKEIK